MPVARLTYFSGTGNTRWVARRLASGLRIQGYQTVTIEVGGSRESPVASSGDPGSAGVELDVFLFPVYAFAIPSIFRRYLNRHTRVPTMPAAVVTVLGDTYLGRGRKRRLLPGWPGLAGEEARSLLERRGFRVFTTRCVGLPSSYTQFVPSPTAADQEQILSHACATVDQMARDLARGDGVSFRVHPAHMLWNLPIRAAFRWVGRRATGKFFAADERCDGCGVCARACPAGVIRMRNRVPRWGWGCESCQRCINICPRQAIQTSVPRAILLTAASVFPYHTVLGLESLWGRLGRLGEAGAALTRIGGWLAIAVTVVLVLERILARMQRSTPLRRVLAAGWTRLYTRYPAPRDRKNGKPPRASP